MPTPDIALGGGRFLLAPLTIARLAQVALAGIPKDFGYRGGQRLWRRLAGAERRRMWWRWKMSSGLIPARSPNMRQAWFAYRARLP